jgi:hypothetical protein
VEHLDELDRARVAVRMARRLRCHAAQIGDYVRFADGTLERISEPLPEGRAQTSPDARFQLREHGQCYCTSGSHNEAIALSSLRASGERLLGEAWIWHHYRKGADNGVAFHVAFAVFDCPTAAGAAPQQAARESRKPAPGRIP